MTNYTYTVLRYIHDTTSGEFVNVGVAIHAPSSNYTKIMCRTTYGRLSKVFPGIKPESFKNMMREIQSKFNVSGDKLHIGLPFKSYNSILDFAKTILPADDSSLQWSPVGAGRTSDPEETLNKLYERMVMRYEDKSVHDHRTEEDVWRHFKHNLETRQLLNYFEPRKISVQDDEIEFHHTWKNGILHCLEPVSFDLSSSESIRDKAHRWLGRLTSVANTSERFRVYFLVGKPHDNSLLPAFDSALSILKKSPIDNLIFSEFDANNLTSLLANEVEAHLRTSE